MYKNKYSSFKSVAIALSLSFAAIGGLSTVFDIPIVGSAFAEKKVPDKKPSTIRKCGSVGAPDCKKVLDDRREQKKKDVADRKRLRKELERIQALLRQNCERNGYFSNTGCF